MLTSILGYILGYSLLLVGVIWVVWISYLVNIGCQGPECLGCDGRCDFIKKRIGFGDYDYYWKCNKCGLNWRDLPLT